MSENNTIITFQVEQAKTVDGASIAVNMSRYNEAVFSFRITGFSGTTPTITPKVEHSMDNVNFLELYSFGSKNAIGQWVVAIPNNTQFGFMGFVKFTWVLGGTDPNFTIECMGIGKE